MTDMTENDSRPIGIFDSGLGGLTVLQAVHTLMPRENIVYFGDSGRRLTVPSRLKQYLSIPFRI